MMIRTIESARRSFCAAIVLASVSAALAQDRVAETAHNLSVSSPGRVHATAERQICIFCHAPHHNSGMKALWNRDLPDSSYRIYQSSTMDAKPGQPTGSSKFCLSCHDGTIALGNVLSRTDQIRMIGGDFIPAGLSNLGTDLSDDHPVSFTYSSGLAAADRQLADPATLPHEIRLDPLSQLQCTSCHDPHHNKYGQFLLMSNEFGELCTSCHLMDGWKTSSHNLSNASTAQAHEGDWPYATVAENACRACHRSHTSGGRERLLIYESEEENCLNCHDGRVARSNILAEIDKFSGHDPRRYQGIHDPAEALAGGEPHVECADCHNPHAVGRRLGAGSTEAIGATMKKVPGVSSGGAPQVEARREYEVCFRCHADAAQRTRGGVARQSQSANLRLKFRSTNPSYHPVVAPSSSRASVSLVPGLSPGTVIRCTDCHNNDAGPRVGGSGPDGPHGSSYESLLERNYTTRDDTVESAFEYALCYKCHQRSVVLSNRSFESHYLHVVEQNAPCSACHDPHGVSLMQSRGSDHTHLINFDTRIVRPETSTRRMRFRDTGSRSGSCTLTCHGSAHVNRSYGG